MLKRHRNSLTLILLTGLVLGANPRLFQGCLHHLPGPPAASGHALG
jgi:hypothetical protein